MDIDIISTLQSLNDRISNYHRTIVAFHEGLGISEREYYLAIVKINCLKAEKQYLEYINTKNNVVSITTTL